MGLDGTGDGTIVITGLAALTAAGVGIAAARDALRAGRPLWAAPAPVALEPRAANVAARVAACGCDPAAILGQTGLRGLDRVTRLMLACARLVLDSAGEEPPAPAGLAVVAATASAGLGGLYDFFLDALAQGLRFADPGRFPNVMINTAASHVAIRSGARAACLTLAADGTAGPDACAYGAGLLAGGRADAVLVVAAEEVTAPLVLAAWPGRRGAAPPLMDGAAALLLERARDAARAGRRPLAVVAGYGSASPAGRRMAGRRMGGRTCLDAARRAAGAALTPRGDAPVAPGDAPAAGGREAPSLVYVPWPARARPRFAGDGDWRHAASTPARLWARRRPAPAIVAVNEVFGDGLAATSLLAVCLAADHCARRGPGARALVHACGRLGQSSALLCAGPAAGK